MNTKYKYKTLENEDEYQEALAELNIVFLAEEWTPEHSHCERLCALVKEYENIHYSLENFMDG